MANGIDWFRWHHGSVTDPKFALVARKANVRLGDVIAVWAYVLETASAATARGSFGDIDCEAIDCMLGMDDGSTDAILNAMQERSLIDGGAVLSWEKRQPKREDETAAERKRRQREREHEIEVAASVTSSASRDVTQSHADVTHGHDREEKSREEKTNTKTARKRAAPAVLVSVDNLVEEGVDRQHATDWLVARKSKGLPLTPTAWKETKAESLKAGLAVGEAIRVAAANGWAGFKASWMDQARGQVAVTVPSTDKRGETFLADQDARKKAATKPPAEILAIARGAVRAA